MLAEGYVPHDHDRERSRGEDGFHRVPRDGDPLLRQRAVIHALRSGIDQVVILAAGYDGRALRFHSPGVTFFEVDHPRDTGRQAPAPRRRGRDARRHRVRGRRLHRCRLGRPARRRRPRSEPPHAVHLRGLLRYLPEHRGPWSAGDHCGPRRAGRRIRGQRLHSEGPPNEREQRWMDALAVFGGEAVLTGAAHRHGLRLVVGSRLAWRVPPAGTGPTAPTRASLSAPAPSRRNHSGACLGTALRRYGLTVFSSFVLGPRPRLTNGESGCRPTATAPTATAMPALPRGHRPPGPRQPVTVFETWGGESLRYVIRAAETIVHTCAPSWVRPTPVESK